MLLVFGILAAIVLVTLGRLTVRYYRMLKNHTYTTKAVRRTFSSLGILFPIEFVLISLFLNINALQNLLVSTFGMRADVLLCLIGPNAVLVEILGFFSTIALGSSVALSLTVTASATVALIKAQKEGVVFSVDGVALVPTHVNVIAFSYGYLQFCRLLS